MANIEPLQVRRTFTNASVPPGLPTVWNAIKKAVPDVFITRELNFITIHYLYIIGMTMVFSGILYGIGGIHYIDALFFSSGACTQSGLNTIDVNLLFTGQQAILYFLAMMCNPIVIHSSVVFVRLYMFEKRFKDIVREARALRRTKSKARTNTMTKDDVEAGVDDRAGVRGRAIQLLRHTARKAEGRATAGEKQEANKSDPDPDSDSSEVSRRDADQVDEVAADRLSHTDSLEEMRLPTQMTHEQQIRFLEEQRNPSDVTALRIPSPREFERGGRVESIAGIEELIDQPETRHPAPDANAPAAGTRGPPNLGSHITIQEPQIPRNRHRVTTFPRTDSGRIDIGRIDTTHLSNDDVRSINSDRANRISTRAGRHGPGSGLTRVHTARTLEPMPYLSWQPTVGRNSLFVNLTEEQREELGGIEYRALKTLAMILMGYFVCFHLFGILCLVPWIYKHYGQAVTSVGQGRAWWGVFTAASAFNDLGYTLTPNSMISFQYASFPLLIMTYLVIIGNTGFPCMLRFVIWALSVVTPHGTGLWEELQFLLDHPRRCFTLLFPRAATWWLFAILVVLNGLDLIFFIILDLHDPAVTTLPGWIQFLNGLFQAASTRTAGFAVVNLYELHPAIQVSYLIMMYISVFPIAISMRRTNVYEEKSLGIYASPLEQEEDSDPSYVGAHLRKQLSFDLWYVFLGLFIIAIVEGSRLENTNEYAFTLFSVLFEIVSAYGTVGLSLGYPNINASFSAELRTLSKLVMIAMQIRGRHRGLPYELDRAVLLPSESQQAKEALEAERVVTRRRSSAGLSAVDGHIEHHRFRSETGLASGTDGDHTDTRERRNTNRSHRSTGSGTDNHRSHLRSGLGTAMYKISEGPDAIRDGLSRIT